MIDFILENYVPIVKILSFWFMAYFLYLILIVEDKK